MRITKRITAEVEIEVQFPYYSKDNVCHWYKAISETKMVKIYSSNQGYCCLDLTEFNISAAFEDTNTVITEEEFNDKYNEVLNKINNNL